jgi:ABC-type arginine/histidine transport system permease subunit
VVSAVAVPEILYTTKNYIALYYKTYEMLAVLTLLCVLLFLPLSLLLRRGKEAATWPVRRLNCCCRRCRNWPAAPGRPWRSRHWASLRNAGRRALRRAGTLGNRAEHRLQVYLELFRAIPVLVWLYLVFFGLPIFFGLSIPSFWCAVLVLALWGASEVGEVVRGALLRCRAASARPGCRSACPAGSCTPTCCCRKRSSA